MVCFSPNNFGESKEIRLLANKSGTLGLMALPFPLKEHLLPIHQYHYRSDVVPTLSLGRTFSFFLFCEWFIDLASLSDQISAYSLQRGVVRNRECPMRGA